MSSESHIGRFEVLGRLGAGGMGVVYRARDAKLERDVAVKVIHDDYVRDPELRRRMLKEARAAAAVTHPGVATVYEIGEDGERLYIVMELLSGDTLREFMPTVGTKRALTIAAAIAGALHKAHEAGVVHRDIKPENVFITRDDAVKVLDFGIARRDASEPVDEAAATAAATTRAGAVIGTPGYMSPEQALGHPVGPASDVFSLGVVVYEMLARRLPFDGKSMMERAVAVTRDAPASLAEHSSVSPAVAEIVERCLAKDASDRPSASEVAELFRAAADRMGVDPGADTVLAPAPARAAGSRGPRRLVALAVAVLGAIGFALALQAARDPAAPTAVAPAAALPSAPVSTATATAVPITALPVTGTQSESARSLYTSAVVDLRHGDWNRARIRLRQAVAADPDFALAQLRLAHVDGISGDTEEARERLRWLSDHGETLSERDRAFRAGILALHMHNPADNRLAASRFEEASQRWPADAELHLMAAFSLLWISRFDDALREGRAAIELDPEFVDALQLMARLSSTLGDVDQASAFFDRCVDAGSLDCLDERLRLRARVGRCAEAVADAKLVDTHGRKGSRHWVYAASALVAQGESIEAATMFLDRADLGADDAWSRAYAHRARLRMLALQGDFGALHQAIGQSANDTQGFGALSQSSTLDVLGLLESGKERDALEVAERFLAKRHTAEGGVGATAVADPSPMFWRVLVRGGRLSEREYRDKIARWQESQNTARDDGFSWFSGSLVPAITESEAKSALSARPARFDLGQVQDHQLGWDALGRAHRLAGDLTGARSALEAAAKSCTILIHPFEHLHAAAELGAVLEAAKEDERACAAYGRVLRWWGDAKPSSTTAIHARARRKKLRCVDER